MHISFYVQNIIIILEAYQPEKIL